VGCTPGLAANSGRLTHSTCDRPWELGITWQQGEIEEQRAQADRELSEQRAQDEALRAYLDQLSTLLLE
jgi:hypothetical protein